jgi:uncharacterized membrane protein YtjA (UPF0391 family)
MLRWALILLVVALLLGALGFTVAGHALANVAWILFLVFLVLMVVSLAAGVGRRVT